MGWFIYRAYKALRQEKAAGLSVTAPQPGSVEEEPVSS